MPQRKQITSAIALPFICKPGLQKPFIIFVQMNSIQLQLTKDQRFGAIQRLTALWAFTESGLGGVMHALQIPFTGLLVGGMAVIMICLIADVSENNYRQVLKSAFIVLIVKAMVSPYTPFPAYIAVSFQALLGYGLFRLLGVNMVSILFLSTIAMVESAIQKLLILTLFFGESMWKALDSMIAMLGNQLGTVLSNGSLWIAGLYLMIYIAGGGVIAWLAYGSIQNFNSHRSKQLILPEAINVSFENSPVAAPRNKFKKLWVLIIIMFTLSATLYVVADNDKDGWLAVIKTISWTLSAILVWFMIIGPLFTKIIQRILRKKGHKYGDEVLRALSFIPVLKQLTKLAWQHSRQYYGFKRWHYFFNVLIHTALTYTEPASPERNSTIPA